MPWGGALEVVVSDFGKASAPPNRTVQIRLLGVEDLLNPVPAGPDWKPRQ